MGEAERGCPFNILHVCDYAGEYGDLARFRDYPGHVVSCPLKVGGRPLPLAEAHRLFGRPVMGGLDRHGAIATGGEAAIRAEVEAVAPRRARTSHPRRGLHRPRRHAVGQPPHRDRDGARLAARLGPGRALRERIR